MKIPSPSAYETTLPPKSISKPPDRTKPMCPWLHQLGATSPEMNSTNRSCREPSRNTLERAPSRWDCHSIESKSTLKSLIDHSCIPFSVRPTRRLLAERGVNDRAAFGSVSPSPGESAFVTRQELVYPSCGGDANEASEGVAQSKPLCKAPQIT